MAVEEPQIADLADRRPGRNFGYGISRVGIRRGHLVEGGDPQIDLAHLETGDLEAEVEPEDRKLLELLRQQPIVPGGDLGQAVVGDREGTNLGPGQMIKAEGRHFGNAALTAGEQPAVPGDDVEIGIDQNRHNEAKTLYTFSNLPDLLLAVPAWVAWIGLQSLDLSSDDRQIKRRFRFIFSQSGSSLQYFPHFKILLCICL